MVRKPELWRWIVVLVAFMLVMGAVAVMGGIVGHPANLGKP